MKPTLLLYGFASFLVCLALHVIVWRLRRPRKDALSLCAIFFALPGLASALWLALNGGSFSDWAASALLHAALASAYIQSYPAAQALSPSLRILLLVKAAPDGLTFDDLESSLSRTTLLHGSLQDLLDANLIAATNGMLTLRRQGKLLIFCFVLLRRLLGLPHGRG